MNIQLLNEFSGLCFLLGGGFFLLALTLFITLRIPRVIGYFTGNAERKAIAFIREGSREGESRGIRLNGRIDMERLGLGSPARRKEDSAAEPEEPDGSGQTEMLGAAAGETQPLGAFSGTFAEENISERKEAAGEEGGSPTTLLNQYAEESGEGKYGQSEEYQVELELGSEVETEIIR